MTSNFNFDSAIIHQTGEQVLCKVDRPGVAPVSVTFVHAVANPGIRVAIGTYLTTSYLGDSPLSSAIISFEMHNVDGTLPTTSVAGTTNSLGTTGAYETTTKVESRSGFGIVGVFVAVVLRFL
ncbi:hypothetical protein CAEBREN_12596 [Caenorhabditis brenneri]|uniref:Uncharacterized protein n=1 Tax=Caenorhabditis brenneri TaxID=135651 RepID=G0NST1_CAEBE|nr:hypothetical protein CAEBREN_12596 [Caenorhabditis brenneri]